MRAPSITVCARPLATLYQPGGRCVGDHARDRAATNWACRIPDAMLEGINPSRLRIDITVLAAAVFTLAVDRRRRSQHDAPHGRLPFEQELEKNGRAHRID